MKYSLKKPIEVRNKDGIVTETVTELTFREALVSGDLRGIKISDLTDPTVDQIMTVAGRLCGRADYVMNQMGTADLLEIAGVVGGFLADGLTTGTQP